MLRGLRILMALAVFVCCAGAAQAGIVITVDKTMQRLTVEVDGRTRYDWPVSTARWGYRTPNGTYRPERLERQWYSRKYDWSPMPYSIFFHGGYAIHGSNEISRLGRPASHGCIRLHPNNAKILFEMVQQRRNDTLIVVRGEQASPVPEASRRIPGPEVVRHRAPPRAEDFDDLFYDEIVVPRRRSYVR